MTGRPGEAGTGGEEASLSLDAILDLLSHHHRRVMLHELRETEGDTLPEDAVIGLLQEQAERRTGQRSSWDRLSASLHHIHVPKLSESGLVTFDEGAERYRYHSDERLERWLDLIEDEHGITA